MCVWGGGGQQPGCVGGLAPPGATGWPPETGLQAGGTAGRGQLGGKGWAEGTLGEWMVSVKSSGYDCGVYVWS